VYALNNYTFEFYFNLSLETFSWKFSIQQPVIMGRKKRSAKHELDLDDMENLLDQIVTKIQKGDLKGPNSRFVRQTLANANFESLIS